MFTDASLSGWGAKLGSVTTGGHWAASEVTHINYLELMAVLLGLQSLCHDYHDAHIRLRIDNTTAVACIERGCSTKETLLAITEKIFEWAYLRNITLSAVHIKGCDNVEADAASRVQNTDAEWMIKPHVFSQLCDIFTVPSMDLFASRINAQLPCYVSWKPDPEAFAIDALSMPWPNDLLYAFPPFSIIGQTLRKLQQDRATVLMILPLWPTRSWFPRALHLLVDKPRLLPRHCLTLPQDPDRKHPLAAKLVLAAMPLSGDPSRTKLFHQTLPPSYCHPGETAHIHSIGTISKNGCFFVSTGRLIHFLHL
jgi:hypothetical protein